ncbi:MAG: formate dehydrogenase gamma subunit [Rhizobiaceae bacterium]|jgi:formate dehydrogenase subunit gamma|nr:formate dehydrogenase gamma subunit [Rhizobiaceae bacterium]
MSNRYSAFRTIVAALVACVAVSVSAPVLAQGGQPASPSGSNPTAQAVNEERLLQQLNTLQGRVSIPDGKAAILQQPQGRDYRQFREGWLPWIGGIAILGMLLALAAFYFAKGRIKLEQGPETGRKVTRFNAFERFTHWLTATAFIILAISGLN